MNQKKAGAIRLNQNPFYEKIPIHGTVVWNGKQIN
jgi:hypothetical protein